MYSAGAPVRPTSLIRSCLSRLTARRFSSQIQMPQVSLGTEKLLVSKQGFGCMGFDAFYFSAKQKTEEDAINQFRIAHKLGVTHFDTAQFYGNKGENETKLGKAIKDLPRSEVQIGTKGGIGKGFVPDGRPEAVRKSIEESLKRLGTDYIDLFYLARIDVKVPIEETMGELKSLVTEGKIRHIGLSEASSRTVERACSVHPVTAVQIEWSLFAREFETDVIPACRKLGVGIVAYSPLGRGFLTGAFKNATEIPKGDFRTMIPRLNAQNFDGNFEKVEKLKQIADEKLCTLGQLALAWVHHQGDDVCPIPGTTCEKHLIENVEALNVTLNEADMKKLNDLFPVGALKGLRHPPGALTFESN